MNYELRIKERKCSHFSSSRFCITEEAISRGLLRQLLNITSSQRRKYFIEGYVAILSVLLVGAVAVGIGFSLFLLGVNNAKSTQTVKYTSIARGLATACADEALANIATQSAFTGTKNPAIVTSVGTCGYTIKTGTGEIRGVYATGSASTIVRRITISIGAISPKITISSWQETQ